MGFSCSHHHLFIAGGLRGTTCYYCGALMSRDLGDQLATAPIDACMHCAFPEMATAHHTEDAPTLPAAPDSASDV